MNRYINIFVFVISLSYAVLPAEKDMVSPPKEGRQYETLTFSFNENLHFNNPFDLISNSVELRIIRPDFTKAVLSFFYNGKNKSGIEMWEARFTPEQHGFYRFSIAISGKTKQYFNVEIKENKEKDQGGIVLSNKLGVFKYKSGEAFRGIGLNVCWANDYEYYFRKMKAAGMNVTRIWMCPWNLSFEWSETGLGHYNLDSAKRLDSILKLAKKYGIYVMLCIDYHGVAPKGIGFFKEDRWLQNPYNKANGGPCADETELFTNPIAKLYMMKKYKYIISRYGSNTNILAWEFFNEADLMAGKSIPINRWHTEMAEYVKSIDIGGHLISSSSTRNYVEKLVDAFKSPAIDFAMFHDYNSLNIAPHFIDLYDATTEYYNKPVVIGEFGVEFRGGDLTYRLDPRHIGLHNAIWAGWFSETPLIPMSWWWDSYIDAHNIWSEYKNLSVFADSTDINVARLEFKTLTPGNLTADSSEQAQCLVRCIYDGGGCVIWFKNLQYQWSLIDTSKRNVPVGGFTQIIPDMTPGNYSIRWYDPQGGGFSPNIISATVKGDGKLDLQVSSFLKDRACIIKYNR